ncbi:hypothetical protein CANMA_001731 [Candida margitis]|uniref:uncharacterized protein n=1 Tax=Candida margitis TaxID=1775924 RepID=UPI00222680AD|nr:uncharacterized protein CANMA_001731 [Candida margitis]KAI5969284.1 hypothetical protein CANMA_001731 [Candida margitis]
MSAISGGPSRKRRRESGSGPEIVDLSDDDASVIDLSNENNSSQGLPSRHPQLRVRFPVEESNQHWQPQERFQMEEDDSDDDIEILAVNTTNPEPVSSDTRRRADNIEEAQDAFHIPDDTFDSNDDLEITEVRQGGSPLTHIFTPFGPVHYHPEHGPASYGSEREQHQEGDFLPLRNGRRRTGFVPLPYNTQGSRLPSSPRIIGPPRHQQRPQRGRGNVQSNGQHNTNLPQNVHPGRQIRPRGHGGRRQTVHQGGSRSHAFALGAIPDFVNRVNFNFGSHGENHVSEFLPHFFFPNIYGRGDVSPDDFENSIMQRIEEDNNRAADARLERESNYNRKSMMEKQKLAAAENSKGTHTSKINSGDNLVCELCGVTLGEGVPEDFKGDPKYDHNFAKYADQYRTQAPWFCVNPFTSADHDLSKRIFASKCGHTFCGRCVKNIGGRPTRKAKDSPSGFTVKNPSIYAPTKCPAKDCAKKFVAKAFTEVYF